jgi:tetratricopeptide (TPR) repeat protein
MTRTIKERSFIRFLKPGVLDHWTVVAALIMCWLWTCSPANPGSAYDQAVIAYYRGDFAIAGAKAETGYKQFHRLSSEWAWKFTILRARVLSSRGMSGDVLKLLESEPNPPSSGDLAVEKNRLESVAYASSGEFATSETLLRKAESICASSASPPCRDLVTARGFLQMEMDNYPEAEKSFTQALSSARAAGDEFHQAMAWNNLTWCAESQEHYDEALDRGEAARKISAREEFLDIEQNALGNMGWAYYKLGDSAKAREAFFEAEKQAERLQDLTDQVTWLQAMGYIDLDENQLDAAQQAFQKSLALAQHTNHDDVITSLTAMAFVSERRDKLEDAKRFDEQASALARSDKDGSGLVYALIVRGRIAMRAQDYIGAEKIFRQVEQSRDSDASLKWEAERSLARLYEDESHPEAALREYKAAIQTFEAARSATKQEDTRLPFLSNATRIYDDYIHFLVAQGKQGEALQVAASSRGRTLDEGLGQPDLGQPRKDHSEKEQRLDAPALARRFGGTILFYWLGQKQSYLWAITPQKATLLRPLPPAAEIDAAAQRYRKTLIHGPGDVLASADADGQYLFRTLVAPAQIKKDAKVLIIPDGSLNNLNFETLLVPPPASGSQPSATQAQPKPHYWLQDVTVVNGSSLRNRSGARLSKIAAQSQPDRSLLLVGNSIAPSDQYPTLPQAAAQMQSVAARFPASQEKILAQQAATPAAYLAGNPERFNYIHFVAHGESRRLSPLDSFIVLSKAGAEEESFKLYARQIIDYHKAHPLHAELVTVSACYSAGERAYSGEGLVGLSWAFLHAGAHNVIAALWDATDEPTQQLMDKFYDKLNQGATPAAALRSAKLSLLHSQFSNPLYWAPFQLYSRL